MDILTLAVAKNSVSSTPGQKGDTGNGIKSTVMNDDYTLTIEFTDGTSYTTPSIRGEKGEAGSKGAKGDKGDTGAQGIQGIQGEKGDKGETGDSAYEIAKKNGFVSTEEEWLESLKVDESTVKSIVDKVVEDSVNEISENISQLSDENAELKGDLDYLEDVVGCEILRKTLNSNKTVNFEKVAKAHSKITFTLESVESASYVIQFSIKDSSGNNLNTIVARNTNESNIFEMEFDVDAVGIGFYLPTAVEFTFSISVKGELTERVESNTRDIVNIKAEHTIDINELKYYQFGNRKTFIATLNDVDHIAKQYDFKFMKGCSYRLKFALTNPLPDDYFYLSFSLKDKDGNNIQTFITRDFHGYVTFKCEVDNALSFGYYLFLRKNTTADFSLTIEYVSVDERINDLQTTSFARPVILDTDFAWDVDDAFAIRAIAWGVLNGAIDLMCVNLSMVNSKSVSAMDGILCEEGIGDCVIGANKDVNGTLRTYHSILEQFPNHKFTKNGDAISDVEMYRKALASLPIGVKADIICIGRLTSIHRLLTSPIDWISPLSGMDLVTEKVNKLWLMGGNFNTGNSEANFTADKTATSYVLTNFPCEIMIQGSEIAEKNINMTSGRLTEGENLNTEISENDYIYRCLQSWLPESNMPVSMPYDPMLVISAIENDEYVSGIYYDRGTVVINEDGSTTFTESSSGNHFVTRKSFDNFYYQNKINSIMARKWVNSKMQKRFRLTR